jgi:hypothetical protein
MTIPNNTADGCYVYGIISAREPQHFAARGIGERGDIVYTLHAGELAAVVSASPLMEYESTRRTMMAHTRVLEEVMQQHTVLPVRFGLVAPSSAAICQMLHDQASELEETLRALHGRIELGLKAFWFEDAIFQEMVAQHAPIRELRDSLHGRSPEETYYERIRLGELIEAAMARQREEDAAQILHLLQPIVERTLVSPPITERMVLNGAFLLERCREQAFDSAIQQLDAEMGQRIMFKYVGPVPPYNFVTLTMRWNNGFAH